MNRFSHPFALVLAALLAACSGGSDTSRSDRLSVAATAVPHAEILEVVKPLLAEQGITLEVRIFNDYVQPNDQVAQGRIDVNYFQTEPYLNAYNRDRGARLTPFVGVHIEPFGAYSRRYTSLDALPEGASVALPNDPSNNSRALILLHRAGVIRLRDPEDAMATLREVIENPRKFDFRELDSAMLPRVLDQVDLALINTNYALDAGLRPTQDALVIEGADSPYVNYLVGLPELRDDPRVQKLVAALTSPQVREYIQRSYEGAVLPAF